MSTAASIRTTEEFVSAAQAARMLGISKNAVIRRVRAGQLAGVVDDPIDHHCYVARKAVDKLLSERESLRRAALLAE
jgi:biotin operon repressor